jgi:hypothetical protein
MTKEYRAYFPIIAFILVFFATAYLHAGTSVDNQDETKISYLTTSPDGGDLCWKLLNHDDTGWNKDQIDKRYLY